MDSIKSYTNVDRRASEVSFDIKKMEDIYEVTQGKVDDPHRHSYYTVILLREGRGQHVVDFHTFDLAPQQIYFISPGQIHQLIEEKKSVGYVMTFSTDFLVKNNIDRKFIEDLHIFQLNGYAPPLQLDESQLATLCMYAEQMQRENENDDKYAYLAIGAWLKLFLILCHQACVESSLDLSIEESTGNSLLYSFQSQLERHYAEWHKVSQYAEALYITADHLNATISQLTGQNAKAHIQNRIVLAAKRELLFSGKSAKEIGYDLGFKEASHFSQFFKKCVGQSPTAFIKNN